MVTSLNATRQATCRNLLINHILHLYDDQAFLLKIAQNARLAKMRAFCKMRAFRKTFIPQDNSLVLNINIGSNSEAMAAVNKLHRKSSISSAQLFIKSCK